MMLTARSKQFEVRTGAKPEPYAVCTPTDVVLVDDDVLGAGGPVVVDGDDAHDGVSWPPLADPVTNPLHHSGEILTHCQLPTGKTCNWSAVTSHMPEQLGKVLCSPWSHDK